MSSFGKIYFFTLENAKTLRKILNLMLTKCFLSHSVWLTRCVAHGRQNARCGQHYAWYGQHNREFQQEFTKHLPSIYQQLTKDLPKIRPYLAFYLLKTYQGITKDLPKTYQRFTKSTKHLPKAIKYFFNLPKIYQQFTKNVWTKIF